MPLNNADPIKSIGVVELFVCYYSPYRVGSRGETSHTMHEWPAPTPLVLRFRDPSRPNGQQGLYLEIYLCSVRGDMSLRRVDRAFSFLPLFDRGVRLFPSLMHGEGKHDLTAFFRKGEDGWPLEHGHVLFTNVFFARTNFQSRWRKRTRLAVHW